MNTGLLIVDADAESSQTIREYFRQNGFDVETATNGLECLAKLRHIEPQILIVNLEILWGGGDGVLARMREDADVPQVAQVLATGFDPPAVLADRSGVPRSSCFQKPFCLNELRERIRATASRDSY